MFNQKAFLDHGPMKYGKQNTIMVFFTMIMYQTFKKWVFIRDAPVPVNWVPVGLGIL